jgi:iron complex transport system substrate-binding protein
MTGYRIASFLPTGTAICYELGLGAALRGVTFECYNPPEAKLKRKVVSCIFDQDKLTSSEIDTFVSAAAKDGTSLYSIDEVMMREEGVNVVIAQDLCNVCAINSSSMQAAMERLRADVPDLQIVFLRAQSLDGMYADVQAVADACGVGERGQALVAGMRARVDRVQQAVSGCPPVRVCCLEWLDPLYNAGHWLPEMVAFAGGVDPLAAAPKGYSVAMDFARLSEAQPDVVVLMPCGFTLERTLADGRALANQPLWGTLPAVRNRQVWAVHGNRLFSGSSPALVDGLEVRDKTCARLVGWHNR